MDDVERQILRARYREKIGFVSARRSVPAHLLAGRGGNDGTPLRRTPWGDIAFQLGREEGFAVVAKHDAEGTALVRCIHGDGEDARGGLAQAFSALYPALTDEKRWVDGVLARKKSLAARLTEIL